MKVAGLISSFDVIGPVMVGPSSSHTAGALRIALLARSLLVRPLKEVKFTLYGSFARTYKGHGTDRALLAGALGMNTKDLRIKAAFEEAEKLGLKYKFILDTSTPAPHPNSVLVEMLDEQKEKMQVFGISVGGGRAILTKINDISLEFTGSYDTLILPHQDRFGVLSAIISRLSLYQVNIASLKLYREGKGQKAYGIIEIDSSLNKEEIETLKAIPFVHNCIYIRKLDT